MEVLKSKEPFFNIDDLKIDDLKEFEYVKLRTPIEPERLKAIYTQAFIYDLLYKFAKEHLPHIEDLNVKKQTDNVDDKSTDTTVDSIKDKVIEYILNINDKKEPAKKEVNETAVNIWDTDDLNILRRNFSSIKERNFELNSKLFVTQEENKKLKDSIERLSIENKTYKGEKLALEQHNERLYIRVQDLERFYVSYAKENVERDKEKKSLLESIAKLNNSIQELTTQKSKLEFELNKREYKLNLLKSELDLHYINQIDKLKIRYKKEIQTSREKLIEVSNKYKVKKADNIKVQKALDHLRIHFMTNSSSQHKINDESIKIF